MNIPLSSIAPFEPHGLPKLVLQKQWSESTLKIILDVMDALDNFMKDHGGSIFLGEDILMTDQLQALADHICEWLEKSAMDAGADIVKAQARQIWLFEETRCFHLSDEEKKHQSSLFGFMFLIDFTVNDESINHVIEHKFNRVPK